MELLQVFSEYFSWYDEYSLLEVMHYVIYFIFFSSLVRSDHFLHRPLVQEETHWLFPCTNLKVPRAVIYYWIWDDVASPMAHIIRLLAFWSGHLNYAACWEWSLACCHSLCMAGRCFRRVPGSSVASGELAFEFKVWALMLLFDVPAQMSPLVV